MNGQKFILSFQTGSGAGYYAKQFIGEYDNLKDFNKALNEYKEKYPSKHWELLVEIEDK